MQPSKSPDSNRVSKLAPPSPGPRFRVLIVEDDPAFADFLAWSLAERGYAVELAADVREALTRLGEGSEPVAFDLVLSDIALPGAPGTDLLFSRAVVARRTPVILMSGFATSELQAFVETCGGEFLSKPFKLDSLFQSLGGRLLAADASPCGVEVT